MYDQQDLFIENVNETILDLDGKCEIFYNVLPAGNEFLKALIDEISWRQDKITLFGKEHDVPRLQSWHCDELLTYSYSNILLEASKLTKSLKTLKNLVEVKTATEFNSVLANLYRDGSDYTSWHSDDEKELGVNPIIASLSLGETRRFVLKHKTNKGIERVVVDLPHGSLLLMSGPLQHKWIHQLNKTSRNIGPRVNLTFRQIKS